MLCCTRCGSCPFVSGPHRETLCAHIWQSVALCQPWLAALLERKTGRVAAVSLADKTARVAWAVMTRKEVYVG